MSSSCCERARKIKKEGREGREGREEVRERQRERERGMGIMEDVECGGGEIRQKWGRKGTREREGGRWTGG